LAAAGSGNSERGFKRHIFNEHAVKKKILGLQVATMLSHWWPERIRVRGGAEDGTSAVDLCCHEEL